MASDRECPFAGDHLLDSVQHFPVAGRIRAGYLPLRTAGDDCTDVKVVGPRQASSARVTARRAALGAAISPISRTVPRADRPAAAALSQESEQSSSSAPE